MKRFNLIVLAMLLCLSGAGRLYTAQKPDAKTLWTNGTPGNRLEPGGSKKNTGYVAGERPGFKTWNWLIYDLGLWTDYLEEVTDTLKISTDIAGSSYLGQTGEVGIGTSSPTAKVHIISTGTGVAFRIDTPELPDAIVVSSDGVVNIASATIQNQTIVNQTIDNLTVNNFISSPKSALVDVQVGTTTLEATKMDESPGVVVSTTIATDAVTSSEIAANAVDTSELNNDSVTGIKTTELLYDVHRQDITANSAKTDQTVRKGWTFKDGGGVPKQDIAITFGITFDAAPIVLVSICGGKNADPTLISDLTQVTATAVAVCYAITTTGFTLTIQHIDVAQSLSNGFRYGATWMAIGTKAK